MTTKILTGTYASGYALQAPTTLLSIAASGYVEGTGVATAATATGAYAVVNDGRIVAADTAYVNGVYLAAGGSVTNGSAGDLAAIIAGYRGVKIEGAAGTVANYGSIAGQTRSGVWLNGGGLVTNGSAADTTAQITGGVVGVSIDANGTVMNFGTIDPGVQFIALAGGKVTNGSTADTSALISGTGSGVYFHQGKGRVQNYGVIEGGDEALSAGVFIGGAKGRLANGAADDVTASISGYDGVFLGAGEVANYGTILGTGGGAGAAGVYLLAGGKVTNGSAADTGALISGTGSGVDSREGNGRVQNYGVIEGGDEAHSFGVFIGGAKSRLANGAADDVTASISGYEGVFALGRVVNYGTILGTGDEAGAVGVYLGASGRVVNGSAGDETASIIGYEGIVGAGSDEVMNFGTVKATGGPQQIPTGGADPDASSRGSAIYLRSGGRAVNGAASDQSALLTGYVGVTAGSYCTVVNYGAIIGTSGVALQFSGFGDTLVVGAGGVFKGAVEGADGTLDLASGAGTITGLGAADVTVTDGMGATVFHDFKTVEVGAGATFRTARAVDNPAGHYVIVEGSLTMGPGGSFSNEGYLETRRSGQLELRGAITNNGDLSANGGTLTVDGDVSGIGQAIIIGGALRFRRAFTQNIFFQGAGGEVELAQSQAYAGDVFGFLTRATNSLDLDDIAFVSSSEATFSGGVLTVTDGTHTAHIGLPGILDTTFIASPDDHGGVLVVAEGTGSAVTPSTAAFTGAMAGLGAGGSGGMVHGGEAFADRPPVLCRPRAVPA